ncbi:amidohydrolase family protein [Jannaschia formosa]|uniref:amidohydrolase family protein n=1 Tax=Jannaschia formosa TaxID=2259592 RepID=UPI000E1C249C|nr:amidohydrolase family protein [Jannaschia formosa]TFL16939.1 Enamidase [Jannaschia formosa]
MSKLVIRNIGSILSGRIEEPRLDGDTLIALDGRIAEWGTGLDTEGADLTVDAKGVTLAPGLIDSHVHPVVGDYTPRQQQLHWIDSTLHGGVTTIISAGEVHMPGRPNDPVGTVAMAIAAQRWYDNLRPSGMKVHAGAPLLQKGLERHHFEQMAAAGVRLIGEVGLGTVKDGRTAREMIGWARELGMQSTIHTGGPSIPGSGLIDADMVLETGTDVVGHINGGHSALPDEQITRLCEHCTSALEIVHNGNERAALLTLNTARELGKLDQIILGTDGPAGSGVQPLGILRMIAMLSSLGDVPAETAFCFATGNTARMRDLDVGIIEKGRAADFVLLDQAQHAPGRDMLQSIELGNLPGVGMTIIDGKVTSMRSRNTPPARRLPETV